MANQIAPPARYPHPRGAQSSLPAADAAKTSPEAGASQGVCPKVCLHLP